MGSLNVEVKIDGKRVGAKISSLSVQDSTGFSSDSCEVRFLDEDEVIVPPDLGLDMEISIGKESLEFLGSFVVSGYEFSQNRLNVSGQSFDVTSKLKNVRSHSFSETNIYDVLAVVARRNAVTAVISKDLKSIGVSVPLIQKSESDINFLRRLAEKYGFFLKQRKKKLAFGVVGSESSVGGKRLDPIVVQASDVDPGWVFSRQKSQTYRGVKAPFFDPEFGVIKTASVGEEPFFLLKDQAKTKSEAHHAASSKLEALRRSEKQISLLLSGGNSQALADRIIDLQGFRGSIDGRYRVTRSSHSVDVKSGYTTRILAEKIDS